MSFDVAAFLANELSRTLAEQRRPTPLPPWLVYPEFDRYSIGWRMGPGESYMMVWGHWAARQSVDALAAYFREFMPLPMPWVDWVGMRLDDSEPDEAFDVGAWMDRAPEVAARHGLVDLEAWAAHVRDANAKR